MPDETLSSSKKNEIFELITHNQLQPTMFEWDENRYRTSTITGRIGPCNICSVLKYSDKGYFAFNFATIHYDPEFSPGIKRKVEKENSLIWSQVLDLFEKWLQKIKAEVLEPDLWEEMARFMPHSDFDDMKLYADTYFNFDEIRKLKQLFTLLKRELHGIFELDEAAVRTITGRFDFLVDFAKRHRIGVWRDYCIGSLTVLAMELGSDPDQIGRFWQTIASTFSETRHFLDSGRNLKESVAKE